MSSQNGRTSEHSLTHCMKTIFLWFSNKTKNITRKLQTCISYDYGHENSKKQKERKKEILQIQQFWKNAR